VKVIAAPDSFKGSASAVQLARAIHAGIVAACPKAEVVELPLADGGEGTLDTVLHSDGGLLVRTMASDPLGRPVEAGYGILNDGTAFIELAQASGLMLVAEPERNAGASTTYGTGELIRDALGRGCRSFILALGGSATNDGGAGILEALGARLLDEAGSAVPRGGMGLEKLACIDLSGLDPRLKGCTFRAATDVTNPLCGPAGASQVFGPQKGADPEAVVRLDRALARYAERLRLATGRDVAPMPGAGAAGGTAAGLVAALDARIVSGIDMVLEVSGFRRHIATADLVITGEGRLDAQTLFGKVIAGVCRAASAHGVPVAALCGGRSLSGREMDQIGLAAAFSIVPGPCPLEEAIRRAEEWAAAQSEQLVRLWLAGQSSSGKVKQP